MSRRVLGGAVALVILAAGMFGATALFRSGGFAEGSAVSAVSRRVLDGLAVHYKQHGRYPESLAELRLDLAGADGATDATLRFVRYRSDGSSFTYAEVGPDQYHRRVWWCAGPERCGAIDLQ
jgi:hypothetical protein